MKNYITIAILLIASQANAQFEKKTVDFRTGTGITLLGSGDMMTFNLENELNFRLGSYLTLAPSLVMGRSTSGVWEHVSFGQGNMNVLVSPFKNTSRIDFRIGGGLSYYRAADAWISSSRSNSSGTYDIEYQLDKRNSFGWSIVIENSIRISERFLVGAKLFTQPYNNGDINSGLILKIGFYL